MCIYVVTILPNTVITFKPHTTFAHDQYNYKISTGNTMDEWLRIIYHKLSLEATFIILIMLKTYMFL